MKIIILLCFFISRAASNHQGALIDLINKFQQTDWQNEFLSLQEINTLAHFKVSPFSEMVDLQIGEAREESVSLDFLKKAFEKGEFKFMPFALSLLLPEGETEELGFDEARKILSLTSYLAIRQNEASRNFSVQKAILENIESIQNYEEIMFELSFLNPELAFEASKMQISDKFPFPLLVLQLYSKLSVPLTEISIKNVLLSKQEIKLLAILLKKNSTLERLQLISIVAKEKHFDLPLSCLTNLSTLELSRIPFPNNLYLLLRQLTAQNSKTLRILNLSHNRIHIERVISGDLCNLTEIDISGNYYESGFVFTLEEIISASPELQKISLNSLQVWKAPEIEFLFEAIGKCAPTLRILKLRNCNFRLETVKFQSVIAKCALLQELELHEHPVRSILNLPKGVNSLSLDSISVSRGEIEFMRSNCTKFKHLALASFLFEFDKGLLLDEMLQANCVHSLDISHETLLHYSSRLQGIYSKLQGASNLHSLSISYYTLPRKNFEQIPSVRTLTIHLYNNSQLMHLENKWKAFPNLKELKLCIGECNVSFLLALIQTLKQQIRHTFALYIECKSSKESILALKKEETATFSISVFVEQQKLILSRWRSSSFRQWLSGYFGLTSGDS